MARRTGTEHNLIPKTERSFVTADRRGTIQGGATATMAQMDFWSEIDNLVTVTAAAGNQALPDIVVTGIPAGSSIKRVIMMLKYRAVENTNAAANQLNITGTEHIQIDKTGGTYIDAIKLIDGMAQVDAVARDGGDAWIGDIDIKAEVDGNDTYETRWEGADADLADLLFLDLQVGVRVYFT